MSRAEITRGKEMAFTKITNVELNSRGATTLPNVPTIGATALKQEFDAPAKQVVAPKFNNLIDELQASTASADLGAVAPTGRTGTTVQGVLNSLSTDLGNVETSSHSHSNKAVIDKFADDGTGFTYDGNPVGAVTSVNNKTGAVSLTASDVGALPDTTSIPANTSDLNNDSNFVSDASYVHTDNNYDATAKGIVDGATAAIAAKSTVSWNQIDTAGTKIAEITIDGVKTDVTASGGGSASDTFKNIVSAGTTFVASGNNDTFKINAGSNVTITALSSPDKGISISATGGGQSTGDMLMSDYDSQANVKSAGGIDAYVTAEIGKLDVSDSAVSGQYVSAVSETDGKISVSRTSLPTIPTKVSDLSNDSGYQTAGDVATAISGKADTSSLGDLAYIDIDGQSSTKVLQGDGTWVSPSSGHTMIPVSGDMAAIAALNNGNDNYVINAYSAKRWSNCDAKVVLALASQGDDGIGAWEAEGTWETGSRTGWLWSADLYHVINDGATPPTTNYDVEVMPVFDGGENETVSLYAFRIDDDVSNGGVDGGAVAFKFNAPIQSANGVRVGVKIINQRTDVTITGTILT